MRQAYTLGWAPSEYRTFKAFADRLGHDDAPAELRQQLGLQQDPVTLGELAEAPIPARLGTVTVPIVTVAAKDHEALTFLASYPKAQHDMGAHRVVGGKRRLHFIGGGAEPTDTDDTGKFNPLVTARRELEVELHTTDADFRSTGLFIDQLRWQLVFTYVAYIKTRIEDIEPQRTLAGEGGENERFLLLATGHGGEAYKLLFGRHDRCQLVTNHAAAGLYAALSFLNGVRSIAEYRGAVVRS